MIIFGTESYEPMRDALADLTGADRGQVERKRFADGERYYRLLAGVDAEEVAVVGGTHTADDTLELFDLACTVVGYGARALTLVIPYFGYGTMERAVKSGEAVTAKNRARLLSSVPVSANGNRVFLLDLHSEGIPHYFADTLRPVHLYAKPVILEACRELGGTDFVLACTDAGRAKWVESLANDLNVPAAFVFKKRVGDSKTEVTAIRADVQDRVVVIYDDMIRTGSSLLGAARAYRSAGARVVHAVATHGVLPGDAAQKIMADDSIERLIVTDSHPHAAACATHGVEIHSIAPVLAERLKQ